MFTLIELPYAPEALEPVISAQTLAFHHGKHLLGYVNNLNAALPGSPYEGLGLEEILQRANPAFGPSGNAAAFNNAGQILNHNLYFTQFREIPGQARTRAKREPRPEGANDGQDAGKNGPRGALAAQIDKQWGSLEAFQAEFVAKGVSLFGSGWVWLSAQSDGTLVITQESGANNPVTKGLRPLLTFDVWEHAYYLDYQNRRADHLKALWALIDWDVIEERFGR